MAFEESFGGQENPGRPYFYKHDTRKNVDVKLVIVPIELEHRDEMNAKYGERKTNKFTREREWKIPESKTGAANKFLASLVWKDTDNAWVSLANEEAASLYRRELRDDTLKKGSQVLMDGRWTDTLKLDLLTLKMANWIIVQATDAQAEADIAEEDDTEKNSQSGLTSDSENTPLLRTVNATDAN